MKGDLKLMWLIVFFDLPVKTKEQRKNATQFRNFLLNDGYMMVQFSIYSRTCRAQDAVDKHLRRALDHLPETGSVRALQVTDKQYSRMRILLGNQMAEESKGGQQLLFF
ncbi:MAG: CRISPR-associated endonuclease Cas2 [Verrucomicrobiota bacterium]